jgi:hypothetical protein
MTKQPASGGPRAGGETRSTGRRPTGALALLAACLSCSLALDADRRQCTVDTDCARRGFDGARCDQGLCALSSELDDVRSTPSPALDARGAGERELSPEVSRSSAAPATDEREVSETTPAPVRYELRIELPRRSSLEPADLDLRLCRLRTLRVC